MTSFLRFICICALFLITATSCFGEGNLSILNLDLNTGNPAPYGMPSVVVNIQGKKLPVIFDTGTEVADVMLTKHALQGIHVKFTGKTICMGASTGRECLPQFIIPKLRIGSFILRNIKGLEIKKLWGISNSKKFKQTEASRDGTIGYSLISHFNVLLDYKKQNIMLYDKKAHVTRFKSWIKLPFDHLYTILFVNHKAMVLYWDTGSIPSILGLTSRTCLTANLMMVR